MKKILTLVTTVCLTASLFVGCMQQELSTKISETGKVTTKSICYIDKSAVDADGGGTTTINDKDVNTLPIVDYKGVKCYKDEVAIEYNTIEEYKKSLSSGETVSVERIYEISNETIYFSINGDELKTSLAMIDATGSKLKASFIFSYEFDKPIAQTNGVIDKDNPNKVTYTFTSTSAVNEIFISTSNTVSKEALKNNYTPPVKEVKLSKVRNVKVKSHKKNKIKVTWKKVKNAKKYQIQVCKNKKFKKVIKKNTKKRNITINVKKLKKKRVYVRVRAQAGKKTGKWSNVKKVKVKK